MPSSSQTVSASQQLTVSRPSPASVHGPIEEVLLSGRVKTPEGPRETGTDSPARLE